MAPVLEADFDLTGILDDVEIGDDEAAGSVNDDARARSDRRLERSIGNAGILSVEGILEQRVLLGGRRLQHGDIDDRRRGLADQRGDAVRGRGDRDAGPSGGGAKRQQPGDDSTDGGRHDRPAEQQGWTKGGFAGMRTEVPNARLRSLALLLLALASFAGGRVAAQPSPAPAVLSRARRSGRTLRSMPRSTR